jgi:valyl-tRNA synthetase
MTPETTPLTRLIAFVCARKLEERRAGTKDQASIERFAKYLPECMREAETEVKASLDKVKASPGWDREKFPTDEALAAEILRLAIERKQTAS